MHCGNRIYILFDIFLPYIINIVFILLRPPLIFPVKNKIECENGILIKFVNETVQTQQNKIIKWQIYISEIPTSLVRQLE